MNDQLIRDLLHEAADDVEPGDRLDAIRAATAATSASPGRRTRRGWWAAGGAGLLAASVATAVALTTGGTPQSGEPDVADPAPTSVTDDATGGVVPIYFVGDTADGPRLFREFRPGIDADSRVVFALSAALRGDALDPDYRSAWPKDTVLRQWSTAPDQITVTLDGAPVERPAGMSEEEARLAIEQLVRTAQALLGEGDVPVDVQLEQQVTDTVLGVATTGPLSAAPDADVLAPVSLSDPYEGLEVDNDDGRLTVRGRALAEAGTVTTRLQRWEATFVVAQEEDRFGAGEATMASFTATFDLTDAPAGDYAVISEVRSASGALTTDTRRITVVD